MEAKEFWRSKTFWWNALALVVFVAAQFGYEGLEPSNDIVALGMGIVAVINLGLRFVTKQPIELTMRVE